MTKGQSYSFTHIISRHVANSAVNGLTEADMGQPNITHFQNQHRAYTDLLKQSGLKVEILPCDEAYPDSVFVEDAVLCLNEGAILMRPGAPSRIGEVEQIAPTIAKYYPDAKRIEGGKNSGFVDGGDILVSDYEVIMGLSARSDEAGFNALEKIVAPWGYKARMVQPPAGVLHLKTACALLDEGTVFATKGVIDAGIFDKYRCIEVPEDEAGAANAMRINNMVVLAAGYPKSKALLESEGYEVHCLDINEAAKLDGGLSCMTLRFTAPT
jgi:dimethylargininase